MGFDGAVTSTSVTLIWYTPGSPSTSQVDWGTDATVSNTSPLDNTLTENHSVTIGGLSPNTTYYFQAWSTDASGGIGYSQVMVKTTAQ
jgi:hypothetical protein